MCRGNDISGNNTKPKGKIGMIFLEFIDDRFNGLFCSGFVLLSAPLYDHELSVDPFRIYFRIKFGADTKIV